MHSADEREVLQNDSVMGWEPHGLVKLNEYELEVPHKRKPSGGNSEQREKWKKKIKIRIEFKDELTLEIDIVGIKPPIANAIRRILLAEVFVQNNTSILPDEVLAHRLGLIPIKADPRLFEWKAEDTLKFALKVKCAPKSEISSDPSGNYACRSTVYSRDIAWVPLGSQQDIFTAEQVGPVDGDIVIARLQPGQEIDLYVLCHKGIGKDHAKFSPVGEKVACVGNTRYDNCSRNVMRHEDLKGAVQLSRVSKYFICKSKDFEYIQNLPAVNIESTGALAPETLLKEAILLLQRKCQGFLQEMKTSKKP